MIQTLLLWAIATPTTIPKVELNNNQLANIFGGILIVAGVVAVIFIIVSSIQYIISMGDASKIKKAKDGILYSVVGLIVTSLAFVIIQFVLGTFK